MKRLLSASLSFSLALALITPGRVFAEDPEKDPDQIGNRDVGKGSTSTRSRKRLRWASSSPLKWSVRPKSLTTR